jgi:monoterpene epsilon-lactone hydrolase
MVSQPTVPGIALPARTIPVPKTISEQAQAFLSGPGVPYSEEPDPSDIEAWRQYAAQGNAMMAEMTKAMAAPFAVGIVSHDLDACTLYEIAPEQVDPALDTAVVYYLHGGGFTVGGGISAAYAPASLAAMWSIRVFSVDYRMPPDDPFPAGLDDAVNGYQELLKRYLPERIVVYGTSAGGGLAAALILKIRDMGLPLPGGCVLHTPEADLTESGDTFETNDTIDHVIKHRLTKSIALYAGAHPLTDPYLSPVLADFSTGFVPTHLTSGTRDLFLSNTVRLHRALRRAGVEADLHVFEAMPHGGFFGAPEDAELLAEQGRFVRDIVTRQLAV